VPVHHDSPIRAPRLPIDLLGRVNAPKCGCLHWLHPGSAQLSSAQLSSLHMCCDCSVTSEGCCVSSSPFHIDNTLHTRCPLQGQPARQGQPASAVVWPVHVSIAERCLVICQISVVRKTSGARQSKDVQPRVRPSGVPNNHIEIDDNRRRDQYQKRGRDGVCTLQIEGSDGFIVASVRPNEPQAHGLTVILALGGPWWRTQALAQPVIVFHQSLTLPISFSPIALMLSDIHTLSTAPFAGDHESTNPKSEW
jgi:hypothetical protein